MRRVTINYHAYPITERHLRVKYIEYDKKPVSENEVVVKRPSDEALSLLNALMTKVSNSEVFASLGAHGHVSYVSVTYDPDNMHIMNNFNTEYETLLDDMEYGWLY